MQDISSVRQETLQDANYQDSDDCAKKFLCELSRTYWNELDWDETLLIKYFNQQIDYSSESLFFNIAIKV